jgi:hypothetical protein
VKETYAGMAAELDQLFEGVSEAEAGYHPAPGAWGFKEILAHLIHGERYTISFIVGAATNQEQWADGDFEGNPQFPIDATVEAFSSLPESLTELKHLYTEIASLCSNLPQNLLERKASYWYLAYNLLQPQYHFQEHMEEIRGLIAAARGA